MDLKAPYSNLESILSCPWVCAPSFAARSGDEREPGAQACVLEAPAPAWDSGCSLAGSPHLLIPCLRLRVPGKTSSVLANWCEEFGQDSAGQVQACPGIWAEHAGKRRFIFSQALFSLKCSNSKAGAGPLAVLCHAALYEFIT